MRSFKFATLRLLAVAILMPLVAAPARAQASQTAESAVLNLEAKIPLGDVKGRIDHMAFDPLLSRLFVAELGNNTVGIVDLKERKVVHAVTRLAEPQGVGYEPSSDTLYVANGGDGSVRLYRGADYTETGRIDLGDDADNIRVDPDTKRILVGYGGGGIATIDPAAPTKIERFPLAAPRGISARPQDQADICECPALKGNRRSRQCERLAEDDMANEGGRRKFSDGIG